MSIQPPSRWNLQKELTQLSEGSTWPSVLAEWEVDHVETLTPDRTTTCTCHHSPIRKVSVIRNKENGNIAKIGTCCMSRLHSLMQQSHHLRPTVNIFNSFKRINNDINASASEDLIQYAYDQGIINDHARDFYLNIKRKTKLTDSQKAWKAELNEKIIKAISKSIHLHLDLEARTEEAALIHLYEKPLSIADRRLVQKAFDKNAITENAYNFYLDILDRKITRFTKKQQQWIEIINKQIIRGL
jgi:hypothetical protein